MKKLSFLLLATIFAFGVNSGFGADWYVTPATPLAGDR